MKLNVLVWSSEVIGVYSSEEKAEEAIIEFSKLEYFQKLDELDIRIFEFVLDDISIDKYNEQPTFKSRLQDIFIYVLLALFLLIIVLGIKSCSDIVGGFLNH